MSQTISPVYWGRSSGDRQNISTYASSVQYSINTQRFRFYYQVSGTITNVSTSITIDSFCNSDIALPRSARVTPIVTRTDGRDQHNFASAQTKDFTSEVETNQDTLSFDFSGSDDLGNSLLCLEVYFNTPSPVNVRLPNPPSITVDLPGDQGSGTTTPTQQKITITARPGQPSGNSVAFAEGTQFTWSISSIPEDRIYRGTQIQFTDASDVTGSHPIFDRTIDGLVAQYNYTTPLSPNSDYIWRAKAVLQNYSQVSANQNSGSYTYLNGDEIVILQDEYVYEDLGGSSSTETETIIETPWSDWQTFHTKDYEQVSVTVNTSSPENNASFVHGKQISFRWSISGGSGVTINSSTIMVDGAALTTISGTGTSYTLSDNDAKMLSVGSHTWYVSVDCSTNNSGIVLVGSPSSNRNTFYIGSPVATANPSSPSGSTTVYANKAVTFTWSLSKNGDGNYTGSQLEYRYSGQSAWTYLGSTDYSVTSFSYEPGFSRVNSVVQWHVRSGLNGAWGDWSEPVSFTVGDVELYSATPTMVQPKGTVKGDEAIVFAWTVKSDGPVSGCQAEYSEDGGISWKTLGSYAIEGETYTIRKSAGELILPAGTISWRVRAAGNGEYSSWSESSFTVSYDAYGSIIVSSAPINSGFRKDQSSSFSAALRITGETSETITFSTAKLFWKMSSGTEYREEKMTVSGLSASVTFPANKFPNGILQWYLTATDSKDNESETVTYVSYVLNSSIDTFIKAPFSIVHELDQPLLFEWGIIAQNKYLSSGTEIRFSIDGVNWNDPVSVDGSISASTPEVADSANPAIEELYTARGRYPFPENYFSAGIVYWQIRSVSSDGVIGWWSDSATFIVRGLPQVSEFFCDGKPFARFSWSVSDQTSYEICIDDLLTYGPFHGEENSFVLPEPLEDGVHTAAIQIQNKLGLLSVPVTKTFRVQNEPTESTYFRLKVNAGIDAVLSWTPIIVSDDNEFLVYCDDRLIARLPSDSISYIDRLALGTHTYKVLQKLVSGDYDTYWHAPVEMHSDVTRLSLLSGGAWIDLMLTSEVYPVNNFTHSRVVEKTKIMGTKYPVVEVSDFEEDTGEYEVCWPYENYGQLDLFKALTGQAIIIKSRADQLICGVLESCSFAVNSQYIKCTFTLEQMATDVDLSIARRQDLNDSYMTNLDKIYFGQMSAATLGIVATNPGYTNPSYYEDIAEAINERLRAARLLQ